MSATAIFRGNVTTEDVEAVLRAKFGDRYELVPSAISTGFTKQVPSDEHAVLVKGRGFARANVMITPSTQSTQIEAGPGASSVGPVRLPDRVGIVQAVRRAIGDAPALGRSQPTD